jgi:hypothetical protein
MAEPVVIPDSAYNKIRAALVLFKTSLRFRKKRFGLRIAATIGYFDFKGASK